MDYKSISQYEGQSVKITLLNNFWYRAKIISISETTLVFVEEKGRTITVTPDAVLMIIPMEGKTWK